MFFFFFKQKTAYEMRISDWSSDVCSSDLRPRPRPDRRDDGGARPGPGRHAPCGQRPRRPGRRPERRGGAHAAANRATIDRGRRHPRRPPRPVRSVRPDQGGTRSQEHGPEEREPIVSFETPKTILLVSGLSGAGKTTALKTREEIGRAHV